MNDRLVVHRRSQFIETLRGFFRYPRETTVWVGDQELADSGLLTLSGQTVRMSIRMLASSALDIPGWSLGFAASPGALALEGDRPGGLIVLTNNGRPAAYLARPTVLARIPPGFGGTVLCLFDDEDDAILDAFPALESMEELHILARKAVDLTVLRRTKHPVLSIVLPSAVTADQWPIDNYGELRIDARQRAERGGRKGPYLTSVRAKPREGPYLRAGIRWMSDRPFDYTAPADELAWFARAARALYPSFALGDHPDADLRRDEYTDSGARCSRAFGIYGNDEFGLRVHAVDDPGIPGDWSSRSEYALHVEAYGMPSGYELRFDREMDVVVPPPPECQVVGDRAGVLRALSVLLRFDSAPRIH